MTDTTSNAGAEGGEALEPQTTETPEAVEPSERAIPSKPSASAREAMARALEGWTDESDEAPARDDDAEEGGDGDEGQPRGPDGRFLPKGDKDDSTGARGKEPEGEIEDAEEAEGEEEPKAAQKAKEKPEAAPAKAVAEPPASLDAKAKAEWAKAPPAVQEAVSRRVGELERGISQYQQLWEPLKDIDALCRQNGTTVDRAMRQYMAFEQSIQRDPIAGLDAACAELGIDFRKVVAHVAKMRPEDVAQVGNPEISQLKQQVAALQQRLQQTETGITQEKQQGIYRDVASFAESHPRFEELAPDMALLIRMGKTDNLPEAYSMAERLNPAPVDPAKAAQTRTQTKPAQTRQASASIAGAPSSGSDPDRRAVSPSARKAVSKAFDAAGM